MAGFKENVKSYRIVWTISEKRNNSFVYLHSHKFTIDNSEWTLKMYRFANYSSDYSFYLRGSSIDEKKVLRSTFFLLSTKETYELKKISKFGARTTLGTKKTDKNETILVCAFDVFFAGSVRNSEQWLEGRTEELDLVHHPISSGKDFKQYSIHINNATKQTINLKLTYDSGTSTVKSNATGLDNGECLIVDWCSGNPFCIGPNETTLENIRLGNEIYVWCQSSDFKEMTKNRISEIADIIETSFSNSLLSNTKDGYQRSESPHILRNNKLPAKNNKEKTGEIAATITDNIVCSSSNYLSPADILLSTCVRSLRDKKFCNITIKVLNGGYDIQAHKLVLVSGSTVWRQLLTNDDQLSIITVPDLDRKIVEALIAFIYDGSVPKIQTDTDQLLIAAATYGVDGLKDWCEQQLMHAITIESVVNLMVLAHRHTSSALFEKLLSFVQQNFTELQQRNEWKSMFFSYPELAMELVKNLV